MFRLTRAAAEQILRAAAQQDDAAPCLRVAAKIENGEIVYGMGFDAERENDAVVESEGVVLLIAPRSQALLTGTTLDFVELRPGEFQFVFMNPNDPGACGGEEKGGSCGGCAGRAGGCGS